MSGDEAAVTDPWLTDTAVAGRWAALVTESPDGSVEPLPGYLDALCAASGVRFRIGVAERDAKLMGGIAL